MAVDDSEERISRMEERMALQESLLDIMCRIYERMLDQGKGGIVAHEMKALVDEWHNLLAKRQFLTHRRH